VKYLVNAFSAGMLPADGAGVDFHPLTDRPETRISEAKPASEEAGDLLARWAMEGWTSAVGHADVAAIFAAELGHKVPLNRATVSLHEGDECLLGQYVGPRLPEGCAGLPPGSTIRWIRVSVGPVGGPTGLAEARASDKRAREEVDRLRAQVVSLGGDPQPPTPGMGGGGLFGPDGQGGRPD
jgi:hypothetical protein